MLSCGTVQSHLKATNHLQFKVYRKMLLGQDYKDAKLYLVQEYLRLKLKDWIGVILTKKATFKTRLDMLICYIT